MGHVASLLSREEWREKALKNARSFGIEDHKEDGFVPDIIKEFRVHEGVVDTLKAMSEDGNPAGLRISAAQFVPGQLVDVTGTSKGKGFQGAMKRHNFKGQPASHGVSLAHRGLGSTGQCQDPGRVWKGKKMPGRMGGDTKTVQMQKVMKIDRGRDLIYVKGQVPGNKGGWVVVKDAIKGNQLSHDLCGKVNEICGEDVYEGVPFPLFQRREVDGCGLPGYELHAPAKDENPIDYENGTV
ncbi:hypothetical protein TeGR_g10953 [Tetraparma gracilis]|uniref:Large ribosomal subunit protein uL3m n=1 Tax=Tetraparma gracilis TaxID=2962635 RepID=A0ABQ6MA69_9STRA|nr:hypothetical protein TeGR_g10953 [Tetraparma gracilis]